MRGGKLWGRPAAETPQGRPCGGMPSLSETGQGAKAVFHEPSSPAWKAFYSAGSQLPTEPAGAGSAACRGRASTPAAPGAPREAVPLWRSRPGIPPHGFPPEPTPFLLSYGSSRPVRQPRHRKYEGYKSILRPGFLRIRGICAAVKQKLPAKGSAGDKRAKTASAAGRYM